MSGIRFLAAVAALSAAATVSTAPPERPNILLLMAEDMSARVGAFGDDVAVTPNLDALARQSVRYTQVFTTAGVCAPSRAAHILGVHQIATGTQHMRSSSRPEGGYFSVPPATIKAYPELLRAAGYYTYTDQKLDYQFSKPFANSGPPTVWDSEGEAKPDWRGRAEGQPFFGFRNFMVTHESGVFRPLGAKPESVIHLVMQALRWWGLDGSPAEVVLPKDVDVPPYYPDTAAVRADIARHYNNIAYMDGEVGAILARLEADGLADSTIVIWTTDHGDGLPRAKRELFDSGIHVPMLIRWPEAYRPAGVEPGTVDRRLISFVDLAPTVLALAGVQAPQYLPGKSITRGEPRQYIYASRDRIDEIIDRQRAVRDERFKYIRSWYPQQAGAEGVAYRDNLDMMRELRALYGAGELNALQRQWFEAPGEERLFDLREDPLELNNVSNNPRYQAVLQRMRAEMKAWLARAGDTSEQTEAEMIASMLIDGERGVTEAPALRVEKGLLTITPAQASHSLEYRLGEGSWRLYTSPVVLAGEDRVEARAVRYGYEVSDVVSDMVSAAH